MTLYGWLVNANFGEEILILIFYSFVIHVNDNGARVCLVQGEAGFDFQD